MKLFKSRWFFPLVLVLLCLGFYYPSVFKNKIPFPGDILVGAYYPWLNYKWGYGAGVPVKNPLISDVYSVGFIEKSLVAESLRKFQLPLWNPYIYSGSPLLANYHSGVFNPFNFFMVFLGDIKGWGILIMCQTLGSLITMYFFLKFLKKSNFASLIGSIIYAFSGFSLVWLLFATTDFVLLWLPLIFLFIEKYFQTHNYKYLIPLPPLIFLLMAAGHIQLFIYALFLLCAYVIWKLFQNKINFIKNLTIFVTVFFLGFASSSIQILPTLELAQKSVRLDEDYVQSVSFGLLPPANLITLFAPDFFGNPTTGNFWGFLNYNETVLYISIIGLLALIYALYNFRHLGNEKFFLIFSVLSLLFTFDNPLSKLIYIIKFPIISTSVAGRLIIIFIFCVPILTARFIDQIFSLNFKKIFHYFWLPLFCLALTFFTLCYLKLTTTTPHINIAFRNMLFPLLILLLNLGAILSFKNKNISKIIILIVLIFDLFRFGWKYTPFVPSNFFYPTTPIIDFLKTQPGYFRIEKEKGALLPSNTWAAFRLSSPSGYEPLAIKNYADYYNKSLNFAPDYAKSSRYSDLEHYDAHRLGEFNVQYLIAFKYDNQNNVSSNGKLLNPKININDWQKVYEEDSLLLLKNKYFQPKLRFSDSTETSDNLKIINYQPNHIDIYYQSLQQNNIILTDTFDSGWGAKLNSQTLPISAFNQTFNSIKVPAGEGIINLKYYPQSISQGKILSYISLAIYSIIILIYLITKNKIK